MLLRLCLAAFARHLPPRAALYPCLTPRALRCTPRLFSGRRGRLRFPTFLSFRPQPMLSLTNLYTCTHLRTHGPMPVFVSLCWPWCPCLAPAAVAAPNCTSSHHAAPGGPHSASFVLHLLFRPFSAQAGLCPALPALPIFFGRRHTPRFSLCKRHEADPFLFIPLTRRTCEDADFEHEVNKQV